MAGLARQPGNEKYSHRNTDTEIQTQKYSHKNTDTEIQSQKYSKDNVEIHLYTCV